MQYSWRSSCYRRKLSTGPRLSCRRPTPPTCCQDMSDSSAHHMCTNAARMTRHSSTRLTYFLVYGHSLIFLVQHFILHFQLTILFHTRSNALIHSHATSAITHTTVDRVNAKALRGLAHLENSCPLSITCVYLFSANSQTMLSRVARYAGNNVGIRNCWTGIKHYSSIFKGIILCSQRHITQFPR